MRSDNCLASKYRLARAVLIQHFSGPTDLGAGNPAATRFNYVFPNLESHRFCEYLDGHPLHFFLGSNAVGDGLQDEHINRQGPLGMLYVMVSAGYCVAFIEGIEFNSSKVQRPQPSIYVVHSLIPRGPCRHTLLSQPLGAESHL